jgi:hypothetical protein
MEAVPFRSGPRHHGQSLLVKETAATLADERGSSATVTAIICTVSNAKTVAIKIRGIV